MAGLVGGGDDAKVGSAGEGLPAGALVEDLLGLGDVKMLGGLGGEPSDVTGVVEDETGGKGDGVSQVSSLGGLDVGGESSNLPGIDTSTASSSRETSQRRQAHARIPALAIADGAGAGATAEMEGDDVEVVAVLLQKVTDGAGDEGVADAVEAVLAQAVALGDFWVDGIGVDVRGDGGVELRVEAGDVDGIGQLLDAGVDNGQSRAIVKGGEIAELLNVVVGVGGNELGAIVVTTVNDAMRRNSDVALGLDLAQVVIVNQGLEEQAEGIILVPNGAVDFTILDDGLAAARVLKKSWWGCEAADLGYGEQMRGCLLLGRVDGDLDRAGAGVDGENNLHNEC